MFRWDDAKVLLALSRKKTLTGASEVLGIDATTVGRRLSALEATLGKKLFERTPDGVIATAAAEQLAVHAETMEQSAYALSGAAEGFERDVQGAVRISVPPGVADFLVAPRLGELRQLHPKLLIELDSRVGYVDLSRREADLALRSTRPERGDLVSVRVAEACSIPVASREFAGGGNVRDPSSLAWITYGAELNHTPDARWVLAVAKPDCLVLRTTSFGAQVAAAVSGMGVMLAPDAMLQFMPSLAAVGFTRKAKESLPPAPRGALYLVAHRSMRSVPRVAAVWDFMSRIAKA